MNYYILLLRKEEIDFKSYSPEDFQKILSDFDKWNEGMIKDGKLILSGNLKDNGSKILCSGNIVKDGPYSEINEAVTGFFIISAENDEEAVETASGCPFLQRGGSVELVPVPEIEFEDSSVSIAQNQRDNRLQKNKNRDK